jgi:hypothetical protein
MTGAIEHLPEESAKETVKTIRVRECRVISGATAVNTRAHSTTTSRTRLRVHWAPGIPHALWGGRFIQRLGRVAPRGPYACFEVCEATAQIAAPNLGCFRSLSSGAGSLRFPVVAMTV